jgi:hypothetical protein
MSDSTMKMLQHTANSRLVNPQRRENIAQVMAGINKDNYTNVL